MFSVKEVLVVNSHDHPSVQSPELPHVPVRAGGEVARLPPQVVAAGHARRPAYARAQLPRSVARLGVSLPQHVLLARAQLRVRERAIQPRLLPLEVLIQAVGPLQKYQLSFGLKILWQM